MKLHSIFTSHMVFAAGKPIRVYGTGEGVATVTLNGVTATAVSENGAWMAILPAMPYGGPYTLCANLDGEEITLTDVYVGEVYLMAGQSNMQFKMSESSSPAECYEDVPLLRMYSTDRIEKSDRFTPADGWVTAKKEDVKDWTAIGYLTGKEIACKKGIAVGILTCYQGASVIESWLPKGILAAEGIFVPEGGFHGDHTYKEFSAWNHEGVLYEYALSQLFPFSLTAIAWYQGESDATPEEGRVYARELTLWINQMRKDFMDETLPVAVIQLAECLSRAGEGWTLIQEAQAEVGRTLPYTVTVPCADICENDNIHPPTKTRLAIRLADALEGLIH